MAQETLAPWAELVPMDHPMTLDEVLALPDDGYGYELVDGRLVRMSPTGGGNSWRASRLIIDMGSFVDQRHLGVVTGADGLYILSKPDVPTTALAPDVAFVRAGRHPSVGSTAFERPWRLPPDLAVEVVSLHQNRPEMAAKARLYLAAGVRLLWLVWPRYERVDIWRPGDERPSATVGIDGELDGEDVLPGFRYPVARLFGS